jgi:chromosome segregation ATPase
MTTLTKQELQEELAHTKAVVSEVRADKYFQGKWLKEDMEKLNAEREELQEAYEGLKAKNEELKTELAYYMGKSVRKGQQLEVVKKRNADLMEQIDIDFNYQKHLVAQFSK